MSAPTNKRKETLYSGLEEDFDTPGVSGKFFLIMAGARPAFVKNIPAEARMQRFIGIAFSLAVLFALLFQSYLYITLKMGFSGFLFGLLLSGLLAVATVFFFRFINSNRFIRPLAVFLMLLLVSLYWFILAPISLAYQKDELKAGIEAYRSSRADSINNNFLLDSIQKYASDSEAIKKREQVAPHVNKISFLKAYINPLSDSIRLVTHISDSLQKEYNRITGDTVKTKEINIKIKKLRQSIVQVNNAKDSTNVQIAQIRDSLLQLTELYSKNPRDRFYLAQKNGLESRLLKLTNDITGFEAKWREYRNKMTSLGKELNGSTVKEIELAKLITKYNKSLDTLATKQAGANSDLRRLEDSVMILSRVERLDIAIRTSAAQRDSLVNITRTMPVNWLLVAGTARFLIKNQPEFGSKFILLSILWGLFMLLIFLYAIFRKNLYRPVYAEYSRIRDEYSESRAKSFLDIEELRQKNIDINRKIEVLKEENISDFTIVDSNSNRPEDHYYISALKKEEIAKRTKDTRTHDPLLIDNALDDINKAIELVPDRAEFWNLKSRLFFLKGNITESNKAGAKFRELISEVRFRANAQRNISIREIFTEGLPFFGSFSWRLNPSVNILLGRNGYGKSHFLSIICAVLKDDFATSEKLSRINEAKKTVDSNKGQQGLSNQTEQDTRGTIKIYLGGDVNADKAKIDTLNKEISNLQEVTDSEKVREIAAKREKIIQLQNEPEPGRHRGVIAEIQQEILQLQEVTDTAKIAAINTKTLDILAEEGLLMLSSPGLRNEKGQVPLLAIPDMRFVNKAREYTDQTIIDLLKGENYLKNSSYHFINQEPYESVLQNLLNLLGLSYVQNRESFDAYIFKIVSNVFRELTGNEFRWHKCEVDSNGYKITVLTEGNSAPLPIQKISQGTFSVLSIVVLIYIFLQKKYPDIKDDEELVKKQAIVIIDEIDAHLHPLWQQKIVAIVRKIFENCQFIITAHSPMVVWGCKEEEVAVMRDQRDSNNTITGFSIYQFREDFIGIPIETLYKRVFDVEGRDQQYERYVAMQPFIKEKTEEKNLLEEKKDSKGLTEKELQRLKQLREDLYYAEKVKENKDQFSILSELEDKNISLEVTVQSLKIELEDCRKKIDNK